MGGTSPGGETFLRRACRVAGFDGVVELKVGPREDREGFTWGEFLPPNTIRLFLPNANRKERINTLLHELGHWDRFIRGKYMPTEAVSFQNLTDYNHDPEERAADRYARKMRELLGCA